MSNSTRAKVRCPKQESLWLSGSATSAGVHRKRRAQGHCSPAAHLPACAEGESSGPSCGTCLRGKLQLSKPSRGGSCTSLCPAVALVVSRGLLARAPQGCLAPRWGAQGGVGGLLKASYQALPHPAVASVKDPRPLLLCNVASCSPPSSQAEVALRGSSLHLSTARQLSLDCIAHAPRHYHALLLQQRLVQCVSWHVAGSALESGASRERKLHTKLLLIITCCTESFWF